jgi:hypothetical protein
MAIYPIASMKESALKGPAARRSLEPPRLGGAGFNWRELLFGEARKSARIYGSRLRDVSDARHIVMLQQWISSLVAAKSPYHACAQPRLDLIRPDLRASSEPHSCAQL